MTMTKSPWIAAALVVSLLSMGPIAPLMTLADAQQMQPPPQTQMQPPPQPMPVQQPPVMGPSEPPPGPETAPVNPAASMLLPTTDPVMSVEPGPGDATAAGVMNVVYIPGKAIICTAGVVTSTILMLLTFGSAYRSARGVFLEGCSPPWALTADHVSGKIPGPGDPGYDPAGRY
jgi:hypothetical protein